jgi:hypothetical protein
MSRELCWPSVTLPSISYTQASVRALEQLFEELKERTAQELAVLPKVS